MFIISSFFFFFLSIYIIYKYFFSNRHQHVPLQSWFGRHEFKSGGEVFLSHARFLFNEKSHRFDQVRRCSAYSFPPTFTWRGRKVSKNGGWTSSERGDYYFRFNKYSIHFVYFIMHVTCIISLKGKCDFFFFYRKNTESPWTSNQWQLLL